jgi:hypothetical protein
LAQAGVKTSSFAPSIGIRGNGHIPIADQIWRFFFSSKIRSLSQGSCRGFAVRLPVGRNRRQQSNQETAQKYAVARSDFLSQCNYLRRRIVNIHIRIEARKLSKPS